MKKLLFAALLFTGLASLTTNAQADCVKRVFLGYDRFGRPVYEEVYAPTYCQPRPACSYGAPVRYQSYGYRRDYDYGRSYQHSGYSNSRPRFSVSFGF